MTGPDQQPRARRGKDATTRRATAAPGAGVGTPVPGSETLRVALAVVGPPLLAELVISMSSAGGRAAWLLRILGWIAAVMATVALVVRPLVTGAVSARLDRDDIASELDAREADRHFRARFERALAQTDAEPAALRAALRAVGELQPDADVTLLLAVPEEPKVGWTVRLLDGELLPARPIPDMPGCAALASNATVRTTSSTELDACAHLQDPTMEVSGTCVPLRLGDRVLGVLALLGAPGEEVSPGDMETLEWVVERTGVRIAEQRRLRGPVMTGREDAVTGLPGAAALERHLRETIRSLTPFCLGLVDVDAFAELRLSHGDAEADIGLRMLADTLKLTLRPDDLVCRLEGARFGVVLANCAAPQASSALERVREALVLSMTADEGPRFTFSAGVVESHRATSIEQMMELAATATREAHAGGGNRVTVASD